MTHREAIKELNAIKDTLRNMNQLDSRKIDAFGIAIRAITEQMNLLHCIDCADYNKETGKCMYYDVVANPEGFCDRGTRFN